VAEGGAGVHEPRGAGRCRLPPERRAELLDRAVSLVRRWGLSAPVVFAVEAHRPLWRVYGQLAHAVAPFVEILAGGRLARELAALLADPESVELFLARLEAAEGGRR
jgi:hypothetical protein